MGAIRSKVSYAHIAATLAVVIACSGTAYAAGLAKNSVKSSHIKNGQVKGADIKNNGVTGKDVNEAKLKQVPDAAKLGGLASSQFARSAFTAVGGFLEGDPLVLTVPGYGEFEVECSDNGSPANLTDDRPSYNFDSQLGPDASHGMLFSTAASNATDPVIQLNDRILSSSGTSGQGLDRMEVVHTMMSADGAKAIRVTSWSFDDNTTGGCYAMIDAQILR